MGKMDNDMVNKKTVAKAKARGLPISHPVPIFKYNMLKLTRNINNKELN
jgi:hypothetical protein